MSDRETIVELLRSVERRLRMSRLAYELSAGASILFGWLTALKLWDLLSPLGRPPLVAAYTGSTAVTIAIVLWRARRRGTLEAAAASIDQRARLHDEMRTAYWFITNPRSSEWVERQIQRAAIDARGVDVTRTFRAPLPRGLYVAVPLVTLFIGVNALVPAVGASGVSSSRAGEPRASASRAASPPAAIREGLERMAAEFRRSEETRALGDALGDSDLDLAAEELRRLLREPKEGESRLAADLAETFRKASSNVSPGLQKLSQDLAGVAAAIDSDDPFAIQQEGEKAAGELERLDDEALVREEGDIRENAQAVDARPGPDSTSIAQAGQAPATMSDSPGIGGGGRGEESGARQGPPSTLDVQLQQEMLNGTGRDLGTAPADIEQASQEERSALAYQRVSPELSQAEKDVLARQRIPWQYRPLVKEYFEALRQSGKGQ